MGSPRIAAATDSAQGRAILLTRRRSKDSKRRKKKTPSLEEQYEAETAGMSAAERLRFLRKKRQENMMVRRESVAGDDFMAEVANNMKKKGKERQRGEGEQVEEERKRRQMQEEMKAKEQEAERKEREEQEARERELRREQERQRILTVLFEVVYQRALHLRRALGDGRARPASFLQLWCPPLDNITRGSGRDTIVVRYQHPVPAFSMSIKDARASGERVLGLLRHGAARIY
ncbi:hypothetical protein PF003_g34038 [Phytophthora fragariae]|nr:hypothetical protein PF003_g34038 [Phytophthora fragariae]